MGWWEQGVTGDSFGKGGGVWGDGPADAIDNAIDTIAGEFWQAWGRYPSKAELVRGLMFSLTDRGFPEDAPPIPEKSRTNMLNLAPPGEQP